MTLSSHSSLIDFSQKLHIYITSILYCTLQKRIFCSEKNLKLFFFLIYLQILINDSQVQVMCALYNVNLTYLQFYLLRNVNILNKFWGKEYSLQ
jgi:hypothetical protein